MTKTSYFWPLMKNSITLADRLKLCKFILTSDRFTQGKKVAEFESKWSKWTNTKYSVFVNSGSSANLLLFSSAMELWDIPKGSKVITSASTWTTTVSPIIQLGYKPIFCDTDLQNFGLDLQHLEKLKKEHSDVKAIFAPHLLGLKSPIKKYQEIFPDAIILEDCCESHGVTTEGNATYSFYFGHHMTTIEGGIVTTNNKDLYDLMLMKRSHGLARESLFYEKHKQDNSNIDPSFLFVTLGWNLRNTELSALLGILQLNSIDAWIKKRRENYSKFLSMTKNLGKFITPEDQKLVNSNFCLPFICLESETLINLKEEFKKNKIEYRPVIAGNLLKHPAFKNLQTENYDYPNANFIHNNGIYVGNNQFLTSKNFKVLEKILERL